MRSLRSFLLQEATGEKVSKFDWDKLDKIKGGRLGNDLKDILQISKAADLQLSANKDTARCYKDPKGLLSDLKIPATKNFKELMKNMANSGGKLSEVFNGKVQFKEYEDGSPIAMVGLSGTGQKAIKGVSDGVRFFKFWIDSVIVASMGSGSQKLPLDYRKGQQWIYVRYKKK